MNEEYALDLIEMGVDLGVFTIMNIFLAGMAIDPKQMQSLADMCALHIEHTSGMPAEDFALKVQPIVDKLIATVKGES